TLSAESSSSVMRVYSSAGHVRTARIVAATARPGIASTGTRRHAACNNRLRPGRKSSRLGIKPAPNSVGLFAQVDGDVVMVHAGRLHGLNSAASACARIAQDRGPRDGATGITVGRGRLLAIGAAGSLFDLDLGL